MIKPEEVPVVIPASIRNPQRYMEGFQHGLVSNRLDIVPGHEKDKMYGFRESFRLGFRDAKLWLRDNGYSDKLPPTKFTAK